MLASSSNFYQVGASLPIDAPSYVQRQADEEFYQKLRSGKFCYVLNSRQMGKSSLRVQTMQRLQNEGTVCAAIDLTGIGKHKITQSQWYGGIVYALVESCQLEDRFDFDWRTWWQKNQVILDPVTCLRLFIEHVLLEKIQQPIVIFVDEIDRVLSQDFSLDDFFALIRFFQNQRVDDPKFERLTFALLGVATPSDLITDKTQTPFNIGEGIELHGFQISEVQPLINGLQGKVSNPQELMESILYWTSGQPFLTQKLCKFMVEESEKDKPRSVAEVVRARIIENWESQDDPEHLRTIRDRILLNEERASYLLELYQQIRQLGEIDSNNSLEVSQLQLSGLIVKRQRKLKIYNPIYQEVFDYKWIKSQLKNLRPYSENFRFWVASRGTDESRLLTGNALREAEEWARNKNLSYQDKQFLAASKEKEIQEEIAAKQQEAALERERKDREAAEKRSLVLGEANLVLIEANRKSRQRISIGIVILVVTVLAAATVGGIAKKQVDEANKQVETADAQVNAANKRVETANSQVAKANKRVETANSQVDNANKSLKQAQIKIREARTKEQEANNNAAQAIKQEQQARQEVEDAKKNVKEAESREKEILAKLTDKENELKHTENELQQTRAKNEDTKAEIKNVRQLVALAGQLRNQSSSDSDEALRLAALSFNIDNHELKQSLLLAAQSQVHQQLKEWKKAETKIKESNQYISKANNSELTSKKGLQVQVLFYKTQGDLLAQNEKTQEAIESYSKAFNILKNHPNDTDFNQDNQLLTGENVESVYQSLRELDPQDKKFELAITKRLYTQLDYFLKAQNWEAADKKTYKLMLNIAKIEAQGYLDYQDINSFSCLDLQRIDQLWVSNSNTLFGFNVQKQIWINTGNKLGIKPEDLANKNFENYLRFSKAVRWYNDRGQEGNSIGRFVSYGSLIKRIKNNPTYRGSLPRYFIFNVTNTGSNTDNTDEIRWAGNRDEAYQVFFSRVATCKL
ncbi:WD-40 repeat-containing protein (plasmid) [Nostoc sp. HK-01]|nr:WD-40 repeat-containing protein [Nostoc sp. HK-01]